MTRVFVVRHGNTFAPGEAPRRIGARTDLALVESGNAQAEALAAWFAGAGIRFARALAGPLRRTRATAAAILAAQAAPPPLEIADWLREIDHGPDEGMPEPAVVARIGAAALEAWDRDATVPPGWSLAPETCRAAWTALFASAEGDTLAVTSNGVARFALPAGPAPATLKLRTGAFGEIHVAGGVPRLIRWDVRP